jgi:hypothetical protein
LQKRQGRKRSQITCVFIKKTITKQDKHYVHYLQDAVKAQESHIPAKAAKAEDNSSPFFSKGKGGSFFHSASSGGGFFASSCRPATVQAKLTIGQPDDVYEKEADSMADKVVQKKPIFESEVEGLAGEVQRKCAACEREEQLQTKPDSGSQPTAPASVESSLKASKGSGSPLPDATRTQMESSFGSDLSQVRIHDNAASAAMNKTLHSQAFTSGNEIYFSSGKYNTGSRDGQHLLAHELTHVVQQNNDIHQKRIQRKTIAGFEQDLEKISDNHRIVISDLFSDAAFIPLVNYLNGCPSGTIDFDVKRITELVNGKQVDLFGGFNPAPPGSPSTMTVNPFRTEQAVNPLEMVDTIVHEFLHAILDLDSTCTSAANPFPLASGIADVFHDPELVPLIDAVRNAHMSFSKVTERSTVASFAASGITTQSGQNLLEYFDSHYGPSASRPETHYIDLNRSGLSLVTSIISRIKQKHPDIGKETVSFDNIELMKAGDLLGVRKWLNPAQRAYSKGLFKEQVAKERKVDPSTYTDREYDISAIQVAEFADSRIFDPNTHGDWGPVGGVWQCSKRSRFTGKELHTYVTGAKSKIPGKGVDYLIIQHT